MALILDGTTGIVANNIATNSRLAVGNLPAGSVLQVISNTTTSTLSTSSASDVATGFSVSITPQFSTSKIILMLSGGGLDYGGAASGNFLQGSIYRGASKLANVVGGTYGNPYGLGVTGMYIDSPNTTSLTTYQVYISSSGGVTGYLLNSGSSVSRPLVLLAMEIAQ